MQINVVLEVQTHCKILHDGRQLLTVMYVFKPLRQHITLKSKSNTVRGCSAKAAPSQLDAQVNCTESIEDRKARPPTDSKEVSQSI